MAEQLLNSFSHSNVRNIITLYVNYYDFEMHLNIKSLPFIAL